MINKLKNLIGGKSDGFFLEFDETENSQSTKTKAEDTTITEKALEALPEPVTEAVEEAAAKLEPVTEAIKEKAAAALEPVTEAIKDAVASEPVQEKATKKDQKTSTKNEKKKSTKTATVPTSTTSRGASSYEPPFWVKAMYNNSSSNSSNGKAGGGEQTFATDNLLPTPSTYRRRPGPSLDKFKEMARQAKTTRR